MVIITRENAITLMPWRDNMDAKATSKTKPNKIPLINKLTVT